MDCEHHGGSDMSNCSTACCHESSHTLASSAIFVMPGPVTIDQPREAMIEVGSFAPAEFVQSFEPLSPPPRTLLFSL
ncbi:MAG TPA: hypothetical protein VN830_08625 [Verrucomicrobiae bacterium]|nr:hypothetical protein [Verrucomicrobiae bacterium]